MSVHKLFSLSPTSLNSTLMSVRLPSGGDVSGRGLVGGGVCAFYVLMVELQKGVQYVRPHVLSTTFVSNGRGSF